MMYGRRLRGFTLLELLVVMGLLSAVMLALGAALRTIAQSEDRVDHRLGQADELRVASAFMRTTLGRVSMDMLACDLTDLPAAGVDSQVVLWGDGLAADVVAAAAGTISYELFCALARRVPVVEV